MASILLERGGYSPGREDVRHAEKNMDQASLSSDIGFTLRIRDREARLIRKITEASERLEDGILGICEECGEEIPLKRRMARPGTTLCMECKTVEKAEERTKAADFHVPDYYESGD